MYFLSSLFIPIVAIINTVEIKLIRQVSISLIKDGSNSFTMLNGKMKTKGVTIKTFIRTSLIKNIVGKFIRPLAMNNRTKFSRKYIKIKIIYVEVADNPQAKPIHENGRIKLVTTDTQIAYLFILPVACIAVSSPLPNRIIIEPNKDNCKKIVVNGGTVLSHREST